MNMESRRGFTLMELLVVMGIILILAALLTPVVTQVLEKGRRTYCLNNVKMIATAATVLFAETSPDLPYRSRWDGFGEVAEDLLEYMDDNVAAFDCPSNKGYDSSEFKNRTLMPNHANTYCEYEFNGQICSLPGIFRQENGVKNSTSWKGIIYASEVAYVYDYPFDPNDTRETVPHGNGANVGFLDGHAEWLLGDKMGLGGPSEDIFYNWGHDFWK